MTLPFTVPDWLPWWVPILVLVPSLLWLLAFLFVPFNVFGVKSRLDVIEARLDEIQGEIRSLSLRLPEPSRSAGFDELYAPAPMMAPPPERVPDRGPDRGPDRAPDPQAVRAAPVPMRPPIPPPAHDWDRDVRARPAARGPSRSEPRLDWPR